MKHAVVINKFTCKGPVIVSIADNEVRGRSGTSSGLRY